MSGERDINSIYYYRLSSLVMHEDAVKLSAEKESDDDDKKADDDNDDKADEDDMESADLSDYDTDEDDDDEEESANRNAEFLRRFPAEKRRDVRNLTHIVSSMEVFSYLSDAAFVQCLEYMEYVDLKEGMVLFDEQSYDGSLYAVVSGRVDCRFEFVPTFTTNTNGDTNTGRPKHIFSVPSFEEYEDDDNNSDDVPSPFISFTAGDGDVVTSLLSMLTGLVRRFQERDGDDRDFLVPVVVGVRLIDVCCR